MSSNRSGSHGFDEEGDILHLDHSTATVSGGTGGEKNANIIDNKDNGLGDDDNGDRNNDSTENINNFDSNDGDDDGVNNYNENANNDEDEDIDSHHLSRQSNRDRLYCLDLLRGLIIVIMAWDHCKDVFANYMGKDGTTRGDEDAWNTTHTESFAGAGLEMYNGQLLYFLARVVSHLCAPGFSFLMGVGMVLFKQSRIHKSGWNSKRVCSFFCIRGIVLLLLGFVVRGAFIPLQWSGRKWDTNDNDNNNHHNYIISDLMGFFQVMTSLGLSMIVAAPFVAYAVILPKIRREEEEEIAPNRVITSQNTEDNNDNNNNSNNHTPNITTVAANTSTRINNLEELSDTNNLTTPLLPINNNNINSQDYNDNDDCFMLRRIWICCSLATCTIMGIEQYLVWREQGPNPDTAKMTVATTFWDIVYRFTFIPGKFDTIPSLIYYPFAPWLSITIMGIAFGSTLVFWKDNDNGNNNNNNGRSNLNGRNNRNSNNNSNIIRKYCRCNLIGFLMLLGFVTLRLYGGRIFSTRGWPLMEGRQQSAIISFLNVCKYPPSICYILLTMGINMILLDVFARIQRPQNFMITRWLLCYGKVALAFYVLHFYMIALMSVVLGTILKRNPKVAMMPFVILIWLVILIIMKFICDRYATFKAKTSSDSIWRFF